MIVTAIILIALLISALLNLFLVGEAQRCHERIETLWEENEELAEKNRELQSLNLAQRTTIDFLMEDDNSEKEYIEREADT
jgi:hypothetical protein